MKLTFWILVIEDRNGNKGAAAYISREAARAALANHCRRQWGEGSIIPLDPERIIIFYYCRVDDEFFDIHECTIEVSTGHEALLRHAIAYEAAAFDADEEINGADLLEWFVEWRERVKAALQVQELNDHE